MNSGRDTAVVHTPVLGGHLYRSRRVAHVYRQSAGREGTARLEASGEFGMETVGCLHQALADARTESPADLTAVAFADSLFIHTLVTAHKPLPSHMVQLFDLTGATHLFHFDT
ncbi:hypothetical protein ACFY7V_33960 [[Kitasatospora] papulosa]|uniref:hypothetical protein n=1 Tax=Streptomyces TaxID=1883 RepID=UPI002FEF7F70